MTKLCKGAVPKMAAVCVNEFRRWAVSPRIWVVAVFAFLWMYQRLSGMRSFSLYSGEPVTPWAFPFAFADWHGVWVVVIFEVLLFCDAPFHHESTPYECIRCGRERFLGGKLLYIWMASVVLAVFLWMMSLLAVLPKVQWENEWGRVLRTLALTSAGSSFQPPPIPYDIMRDYTPIAASFICILLITLQGAFVGSTIFVLNSVSKLNGLGVIGGLVLAFLPSLESPVLGNMSKALLEHFIPSGWINLSRISLIPASGFPGYGYILGFFGVFFVCAYAFLFFWYRRKEIAVVLPV